MREIPLMKRCSPRRGKKILGVTKQTADLSRIHRREQKDGWQPVEIRSADGTKLRGTYIENSRSSDRTVILLHGLYQNRSMCIPYVDMYRDMGYNVLLIDQRGHGESGGSHTTWGLRETDDLDAWTEWLRGKRRCENRYAWDFARRGDGSYFSERKEGKYFFLCG